MIGQDAAISRGKTIARINPAGWSPGQYQGLASEAQTLFEAGRVHEAIRLYEEAIESGLDRPAVYKTLGQLYLAVRQYDLAAKWLRLAAGTVPPSPDLWDQLVWALLGSGQVHQAKQAVAQALEGCPSPEAGLGPMAQALISDDPSSLSMVANTLFEAGQYGSARHYYQRIASIQPSGLVYGRLGHICRFMGAISDAAGYLQQALDLDPTCSEVLANLGNTLILLGRIEQGVGLIRQALALHPDRSHIHSNYLVALHYLPDQDRALLFDRHVEWGHRHAPASLAQASHGNDPDPDRRLRVGYVSADLHMHSVAYTFEAFLSGRNPDAVEVFGYSNASLADGFTNYLSRRFDHFRLVREFDDPALADLIRQDRIDILVAVAGHMAWNRLGAFAYQPAPIQVDYGSISTIGMEQIGFRLTDTILDPPEVSPFYLEELVYIPGGQVCYKPPLDAPDVGPLSALHEGRVTFGSFNGRHKINTYTLALWAAVLRAVPDSQMLIKCGGGDDPAVKEGLLEGFERHGIGPERIRVLGLIAPLRHLALYNQVDIALDTYPYNGGLTTLEGLWMGVPAISLAGPVFTSRAGLAIMSRLGMSFCVASNPDEYVQKAATLAGRLDLLAKTRGSLRHRMSASPLCDSRRFGREVEAGYRRIWHRWCEKQIKNQKSTIKNDEPTLSPQSQQRVGR